MSARSSQLSLRSFKVVRWSSDGVLRCSKMFPLSSDFVSRCSEYALQSSEIASRSLFVSERSFQVSPRSLKRVPRGSKWFIGPTKCCHGVLDLLQNAPIWFNGAQFYPRALKCLPGFSMQLLETVKWFCRGPMCFHGVPILFHGAPNLLRGVSNSVYFSIFTLKSYHFLPFRPFQCKEK